MSSHVRILGIAGSLRRGSYNQAALRAAKLLVPENSEIDLFQLDGIPMFNEDDEKSPPSSVVELKKRIRRADAVLIVTTEYNYSIPGVLKNAIDWASRPYGDSTWSGKSAAIMGASLGAIGSARAQYYLRQILVALNLFTLNQPEVVIADAAHRFDENGNLHHRIFTRSRWRLPGLVTNQKETCVASICASAFKSGAVPPAAKAEFFKAWGTTDVKGATRLVDLCLDSGLTLFDSADIYSGGAAEEILGEAIKRRRNQVLISTKATFRLGEGPNDVGSSRFHLIEASLRRLRIDHLDLFQLHGFDAMTPIEELVGTRRPRSGRKDPICRLLKFFRMAPDENPWQCDRHNLPRYVVHQAHYSLVTRDSCHWVSTKKSVLWSGARSHRAG